jgi:transposase
MPNREERRRLLAYEIGRMLAAGASQREIARALRLARKTVKRILREQAQRRQEGESAVAVALGRPRVPKGSRLDAFDEKIRGWLEKYPKLTAVRCLEKLQEEGFSGGTTIVRERVKALRAPKVPVTVVVVETAPGQRLEFDWSPYVLADGLKVQLWNATLCWSRALSLAAETNSRQTTILVRLRWTFERIGGVTRECLTDSMPGVVDRWECDLPILNPRFVDFAAHYGFTAAIAPRACPEWKGGCERRFRYHEENLLNGRTIHGLEAYRELLDEWQREKALRRPHPVRGGEIARWLEEERAHLLPLPAKPYDTRDVIVRIVSPTGHAHHLTNEYSLPDGQVGKRVYVCVGPDRVEICDDRARVLIEHERLPDAAGIRMAQHESVQRRARYDVDALVDRLAEWGPVAAEFAGNVRRTRRYAGPELVRLLNLQLGWTLDDLTAAMKHAQDYGCFETRAVERILEARFTPRCFEQLMAESTRRRIQEVMKTHPIAVRALESYASLRIGDRRDPSERKAGHDGETQAGERTDGESDAGADPGGAGGPAAAPDAAEPR